MEKNNPTNEPSGNSAPPDLRSKTSPAAAKSSDTADEETRRAAIALTELMQPDKGSTYKEAEVRTVQHAIAQGAPASIALNKVAAAPVTSPHVHGADKGTASTSSMATNAKAVTKEADRGVAERFVVSEDRTFLAGRIENGPREEKEPDRTFPAGRIENGPREEKEPADDSARNVPLEHSKSNAHVTSGSSLLGSYIGGGRQTWTSSFESGSKQSYKPQTQSSTSLRGGAPPNYDGARPLHKPSKAPWHGAQTTTAQQYLQSTAQPESAEDGARRAHLNMANELARTIAQAPPHDELSYAVIEGPSTLPVIRPAVVASFTAGNNAQVAPHTTFSGVYIHTAKCDICNKRNRSVLQRCNTCTKQMCRECMGRDPIHSDAGLDWTNHGAQTASKPRTPRVKTEAKAKPSKKPTAKTGIATSSAIDLTDEVVTPEERLAEQQTLFAQSRNARLDAQSSSRGQNSRGRGGRASIPGRGRQVSEEADDDDDVMIVDEQPPAKRARGRDLDGASENPRKRNRAATIDLDDGPPSDFRPLGASVPYSGAGVFEPVQKKVRFSVADRDKEVPVRRAPATKSRITVEDEEYTEFEEAISPKSKVPPIRFRNGGQAAARTPTSTEPAQPAPLQAQFLPANTAFSGSAAASFFAETDQLRNDYLRVTTEINGLTQRMTELKEELVVIEDKINKRMGN